MSNKIGIISYLATYGNAPLLCKGFESLGYDVSLLIAEVDMYGFCGEFHGTSIFSSKKISTKTLESFDKIILIALPTYLKFLDSAGRKVVQSKKGAYIISCSHSLKSPTKTQDIISESKLPLFCMPDLVPYIGNIPYRNYLPPVFIPAYSINRLSRPLTIGHSPGKKSRYAWKGTDKIAEVLKVISKDLGVQVKVISGLEHRKAMMERAKCNIFIDQMHDPSSVPEGYPDYCGGLGKSGVEALASGCLVIHSGNHRPTIEVGEEAPTILTDSDSLYDTLYETIKSYSIDQASLSREWAEKWCRPTQVAERLLRCMI